MPLPSDTDLDHDRHLHGDVNVNKTVAGGFVIVRLRDTDDGDTFQLGEDEILALHQYLGQVIADHKL